MRVVVYVPRVLLKRLGLRQGDTVRVVVGRDDVKLVVGGRVVTLPKQYVIFVWVQGGEGNT